MNLKKLLSAVGLLTVVAPAAISVAACGEDPAPTPEQKEADKLKDAINAIAEENRVVTANTAATAEPLIANIINEVKGDSTLEFSFEYTEFKAPVNAETPGEYTVTVSIKKGDKELAKTENLKFTLNWSQDE